MDYKRLMKRALLVIIMKYNNSCGVRYPQKELLELLLRGDLVAVKDTHKGENHYLLRYENYDGEILYEVALYDDETFELLEG